MRRVTELYNEAENKCLHVPIHKATDRVAFIMGVNVVTIRRTGKRVK
jgi:hypothetical protein